MVTVSEQPDVRRAWQLFADLLDYPYESPAAALEECRLLTEESFPKAGAKVAEFQEASRAWDLGRLQEEYTKAFDLDETHSLYVGYHLLGESYKRSAMLLEFKERYRTLGMEVAGELADHLPVVLRFLGMCDDADVTDEILVEAVWSMLDLIARKDNKALDADQAEEDRPPLVVPPYHGLLGALLDVVRAVTGGDSQPLVITVSAQGPPSG